MRGDVRIRKVQRLESYKRIINLALMAINFALEVAIFSYFWVNHFQPSVVYELRKFHRMGHLAEISLYAGILLMLSIMYGGMRLGYMKIAETVFSQILATILANIMIYMELSVLARQAFVPQMFLAMMFDQMVVIVVYTNLVGAVYKRLFPPRKLLLISGNLSTNEIKSKFESRRDKYVITDEINVNMGTEKVLQYILDGYFNMKFNAVVIWDIPVDRRNRIIKFCYAQSIRFYLMPKITDVIISGAEELKVFDSPMLLTREYCLTMEQRFIKRTIDIVFALILIIVTSPIMLIAAIAIKLYDGGDVFYKQVRCTKDLREFKILKFRSMRQDAEKDGVARLASKHDDRITPVGRIIRKCRADELPQLFNILKGDMTFIGPRPERPEIIKQYVELMPEFVLRTKVKAGLAGYAQVYGKYNTAPYDKLKLDLTYIEKYSLWLDIKLMMLTIKVLFWPDSTEGVEVEQISALRAALDREKSTGENIVETDDDMS